MVSFTDVDCCVCSVSSSGVVTHTVSHVRAFRVPGTRPRLTLLHLHQDQCHIKLIAAYASAHTSCWLVRTPVTALNAVQVAQLMRVELYQAALDEPLHMEPPDWIGGSKLW